MRLVIDTDRWLHSLRRWWWNKRGKQGSDRSRCYDCGKRLSAVERQYYGHTCERCEGIDMQRYSEQ